MKVRVIQQGDQTFTYDGQDEASIRQALLHEPGVPGIVYDITDLDRSDMDADEYMIATEDDGTPVWSGWLGGVTAPPPLDRDALNALAAKWEAEAVDADPGMEPDAGGAAHYEKRKAVVRQKRICVRQLLQALGQPS